MPKFVAVIAYLSPDERKAAHDAAYANRESLSEMIKRLLAAEVKRIERQERRKAATTEETK